MYVIRVRERERERERLSRGKLDECCVSSGGVYTAHNIRHSRDGEKMSEEKGASGRATGRQDGYKRRRIIAVVMMTSCSSSASWEGMLHCGVRESVLIPIPVEVRKLLLRSGLGRFHSPSPRSTAPPTRRGTGCGTPFGRTCTRSTLDLSPRHIGGTRYSARSSVGSVFGTNHHHHTYTVTARARARNLHACNIRHRHE